ncbi:23S rRNA (uracil(1939)-C(5))-methyltransferase RlmD [Bombilactobacillus thymidiniphilus]|uniref:23S rRNA (Uracil(1939)-C(5))-methyltransferase RlmD n=1 Tax=Bombilactobacillus thymidiniphilus TaxID=2923363 RepID=A0ABY4PC65_9LACO|nr:23S rRNA (uracil(1939)-C(5))-methyltransferase RlmD [Bombilactobacillus thymidiniphilus]UQS83258.1 23S rRNA (uracil(1939)-C(5))-methyltransferase RlmD [Bombilactobacillus thymidiniphilus]
MKNQTAVFQVGQKIKVTIKKLGINGEGIAYLQKKLVFITQALPQEIVTCEITQVKDHFLRAKVLQFHNFSSLRNLNPPELYGQVGGLELVHLKYPAQLKYKHDVIMQALTHFHPQDYQNFIVKPTIGMTNPWHYRNKAQFQLREIHNQIVCGLYQNQTHTVIDSLNMPTQKPLTLSILQRLVDIMTELAWPIYDPAHNSGIFKTVIVRESVADHNAQLTLVTNSWKVPHLSKFLSLLQERIPEVISLSQNFNPGETSLVWGDQTKLLWGKKYLHEQILGFDYLLSPQAFLQLNPHQTAKLYQTAIAALKLTPQDIVVDAYAGVGTIGIAIAKKVKQVIGSEIIPAAVNDAQLNIKLNKLSNITYEVGKTENLYPQWLQQGIKPTALIVDPPRTGLEKSFTQLLLKYCPAKMIYISCNPSTLARDLKILRKRYQVEFIQPFDMFPQTPQTEAVVSLRKM